MLKFIKSVVRAMLLGGSGALSLWSQEPAPRVVAHAARELARGTVLTSADIATDAAAPSVLGWETRRLVRAGEALRAPAIAPPTLVVANSVVQVVADVHGVRVSRPGTALGAGALGEKVRIRLDQQRTITAIVAGVATVRPS